MVEESQLVFNGVGESIDCVAMLTESAFVSGSENGTLALWDSQRKKPQHTIRNAHGANAWITAVGALRFGDVAASGSSDGRIKVWACDDNYRKLTPLSEITIVGVITGIVPYFVLWLPRVRRRLRQHCKGHVRALCLRFRITYMCRLP